MPMQRPFRFGVVAPEAGSADAWVANVRRAEALGYSTVVLPDGLGPRPAPMIALAAAAAATTTLRVGPYVLANDYRNPVIVAREAATLDVLSGGRFELGIGAGRPSAGNDYRALGMPFESGGVRIDRLAESLRIIKAMLGGERASATGPWYAVADAEGFPRPVQQPRPPILVAGGGKRILSLAAREADIVGLGVRPDATEAAVAELIEWVRGEAGDRFEDLELNIRLAAVAEQPAPYLKAIFGFDPLELDRSGSASVLMGSPDAMCERLLARRAALGVSYYLISEDSVEAFAPVVERLAGR